MAWREEAEQGFPPQRHQEPFALRKDILDELADHLALAANRESEAGAKNDKEIRSRVLTKFGNPTTVAHSLWWGAMKETIVKDWIQITINAILCIGVILFMGLFYQQMNTSNTALLNALNERSAVTEIQEPSVEFILHRGSIDGPVIEGVDFSLSGHLLNEVEITIQEKSDGQGRVIFGPIRVGRHTGSVYDEISGMKLSKSITLYSGGDTKTVHIIFPPESPRPHNLKLPIDEKILNDDLQIVMSMHAKWNQGDDQWHEDKKPGPGFVYKRQTVIATADGIFKALEKKLGNKPSYQIGEKITHVYGNELEFSKVGILALVSSDKGSEKWFSRKLYKNKTTKFKTYSFSQTTQENDNDSHVLNLPQELEEAYAYHSRRMTNEQHNLPYKFAWFPEWITDTFEDYVIDEVQLVEQSQMREWSDEEYAITPGSLRTMKTIYGEKGQAFSLKNVPTALPKGYRLILGLKEVEKSLVDLNSTLGAYLDTTPTVYDEDTARKVKIEHPAPYLTNDPLWKLDAGSIEKQWHNFAFLDLTAAYEENNSLNPNHGILLKWMNPTNNSLLIKSPELASASHQPMWIILRPIGSPKQKISESSVVNTPTP